jgi:curved DNA-binding protein CbpA
MQDLREDFRRPQSGSYSLAWRGNDGLALSGEARGIDISTSGVGVECPREIKPGSVVYVQARDGALEGECVVVHCTRRGTKFQIGLELREEVEADQPKVCKGAKAATETDYYDVLQISPKADLETIHRVFRIMAVRFHPDNPETGDVEEFLRLKAAYAVLSDPPRRAEYDNLRETNQAEPMPIFELKDFVTGVEAESNRRLGVLSLLYNQRRMDPDHPGISLLDLEKLMGFPREYLSFTMWYLRSKEFVIAADNSDFALTAAGADYVESNAPRSDIVTKLIKMGPARAQSASKPANGRPERSHRAGLRYLQEPGRSPS